MDKTTITKLLRVSWEAVARIVVAVVNERLDRHRLEGLYSIGVDDVSYRKGYRYLTVIADHDHHGAVVWAAEGNSSAVLEAFFDELGPEGVARLEAVSLDMSPSYKHAVDVKAPHVRQCVDPFHVIQRANLELDKLRRQQWSARRPAPREPLGRGRPRDGTGPPRADPKARWFKRSRWALLKDPSRLSAQQWQVIEQLKRERSVLYRGWELKEALRGLYRLDDPADAPAYLEWWLRWASRSRIAGFVRLAKTLRADRERVLASIELGLSNSKLEGLNSKIRLINHRGYGHHSAAAVIAMVYLCAGGITIELPLT